MFVVMVGSQCASSWLTACGKITPGPTPANTTSTSNEYIAARNPYAPTLDTSADRKARSECVDGQPEHADARRERADTMREDVDTFPDRIHTKMHR